MSTLFWSVTVLVVAVIVYIAIFVLGWIKIVRKWG